MSNYEVAMTTFCMSQCQDGDEDLKCFEWRCQGIKRHLKTPEHMKEHIKRDSNRFLSNKF